MREAVSVRERPAASPLQGESRNAAVSRGLPRWLKSRCRGQTLELLAAALGASLSLFFLSDWPAGPPVISAAAQPRANGSASALEAAESARRLQVEKLKPATRSPPLGHHAAAEATARLDPSARALPSVSLLFARKFSGRAADEAQRWERHELSPGEPRLQVGGAGGTEGRGHDEPKAAAGEHQNAQKVCPSDAPLRTLFAHMHAVADRRREREARARLVDPSETLLVLWDAECLAQLPRRVAALAAQLDAEERDLDAIPLLGVESERPSAPRSSFSARSAAPPRQPAVVFRKGVFFRDHAADLRRSDLSDAALEGRALALSILAGALGVRVSAKLEKDAAREEPPETKSSEDREDPEDPAACTAACKRLRRHFLSAAARMRASLYTAFHIDVLHITNLPAVMARLGLATASALPAYLAQAHLRMHANRAKFAEAARCMQSVSPDSPGTPQTAHVEEGLVKNPDFEKQWHHLSEVANFSLWADKAWRELPPQSESQVPVVALIDTGCAKHEDYWNTREKTSDVLWKNENEDCENGLDDDENGYVDDCWGWNFAGNDKDVFVDDSAHGTTMASLLAAKRHDAQRGVGVMKFGKVMCLKAGAKGRIYASAAIAAIQYAIHQGAKISVFAHTFSQKSAALEAVFQSLEKRDHLVVASAGLGSCDLDADEDCRLYPAAFALPSLLVVGASKLTGGVCCSSNWGKKAVHVFAPGNRLWTGTNVDHARQTTNCATCAAFAFGSSGAAALTAGAAAMVWGYLRHAKPIGWTSSKDRESVRVKKALVYGSTPSRRLAGACEANGIVNIYKAMHYYDSVPAPFKPEFADYPSIFQLNFPPFFKSTSLPAYTATIATLLIAATSASLAVCELSLLVS
ncbi:subtilisin SUB6 [Besnoitia besnoiti]|uniref:subtilisin n=1 Tax=Besnoitia besnoiti TaxID=94643 RepID=A0A2A9ML71_BESBE|nr:subtilisin SUB6 [Besnoitia besnoiti]PFH36200.1 subtilisin SUB6 [Besnoitia besnoiti]